MGRAVAVAEGAGAGRDVFVDTAVGVVAAVAGGIVRAKAMVVGAGVGLFDVSPRPQPTASSRTPSHARRQPPR